MPGYKFCDAIRHKYRHLDHNTSSWPKGPRANKKQHILVNFELWYKCRYSIQYSFQRGIRWFNQIFSILNNYVTVWGPIWHKNSKKIANFTAFLAISHLFFTPFSKIFFHFIIRLLKCYKNIPTYPALCCPPDKLACKYIRTHLHASISGSLFHILSNKTLNL